MVIVDPSDYNRVNKSFHELYESEAANLMFPDQKSSTVAIRKYCFHENEVNQDLFKANQSFKGLPLPGECQIF